MMKSRLSKYRFDKWFQSVRAVVGLLFATERLVSATVEPTRRRQVDVSGRWPTDADTHEIDRVVVKHETRVLLGLTRFGQCSCDWTACAPAGSARGVAGAQADNGGRVLP